MQIILNPQEIEQKIERLAHQLVENCFEEGKVFVGGIKGNGLVLAKKITDSMNREDEVEVELFSIDVNKTAPWNHQIALNIENEKLKNAYIIIVDDVLNSGKTMQYALTEFLKFPTKAIKTVALVDRKHRRFPIKANFVGLSLSTTLKEHVQVDFSEGNEKVYLV